MAIYTVTRRQFLRDVGVGAGALVLGCAIPQSAEGWSLFHKQFPLNNFVSLELDGTVHIIAHRSEMGQGTRSSLAAVLIDEMGVAWDKVRIKQADADAFLFGVPFPVNLGPATPAIVKGEDAQFVDSSRSMAAYYLAMRYFGAGIRLVMLKAAAYHWGLIKADPATFKWGLGDGITRFEAREGRVYDGSRSIAYEHLLIRAGLLASKFGQPTQFDITPFLKTKEQWKYIGTKNMPFSDCEDMVTGKAVYGADVDRPGMLIAMIERCPVANGKVKSFDAGAAMKVPGVKYVTKVLPDDFVKVMNGGGGVGTGFVPHDGIAVIAENTWAALQGRRALRPTIEWDVESTMGAYNKDYDTDVFRQQLENVTKGGDGARPVRYKGDVAAAFDGAAAGDVHEASYWVPHLAQTPMEPPVALAIYENGKFEIWSPTQGPELTQHYLGVYLLKGPDPVTQLLWTAEELYQLVKTCERPNQDAYNKLLAKQLGVTEQKMMEMRDDLKKEVRDKITVHVTLLGGGFGRKSNPDYAIEAAFLAKQYPGVPIRVQWTREDDIQFSYYNSAAGLYYKAALGADNRPTAFLERSAFTSFFGTLFPLPSTAPTPELKDLFTKARAGFHNGGEYPYGSAIEKSQGLEDMPYAIDNIRIENSPAENHVRCGWMRSVANIYHAFGTCSFADELANKAGVDSKDYLLGLIGKGEVFNGAKLTAQHVACLDNNQFPVDPIVAHMGGGVFELVPDPPPMSVEQPNVVDMFNVMPAYAPDTRRLRAVVERVAQESGWNEKVARYRRTRRGLGIAAHRSFLSYNACVIDVSLSDKNELTIHDIWSVLDCGMAVNVDRVLAQIEGGVNYGLSIALFGEITLKNGRVQQNNFDDYPVLRIHQTPKMIHTIIQDPPPIVVEEYKKRGDDVPPTGVGEPPTPAVAPALANAIVAAGGPRIREIPFRKHIVVT